MLTLKEWRMFRCAIRKCLNSRSSAMTPYTLKIERNIKKPSSPGKTDRRLVLSRRSIGSPVTQEQARGPGFMHCPSRHLTISWGAHTAHGLSRVGENVVRAGRGLSQ